MAFFHFHTFKNCNLKSDNMPHLRLDVILDIIFILIIVLYKVIFSLGFNNVMTRGRRNAAQKKEDELCYMSSSFFQFWLTPLSISAVADFSASSFYVFFRNGVSSTSRTSDAAVGEPPPFPFSSPLRPFCRKLSRATRREVACARESSVKYFGSVNR